MSASVVARCDSFETGPFPRFVADKACCHSYHVSAVVFPFNAEDPVVASGNLATAASHPRVEAVMAVGVTENSTFDDLSRVAQDLSDRHQKPVHVRLQQRIGDLRAGKGDGMNTGLAWFLDHSYERLHFYDADITNFDHTWIDGAETAADAGYPFVRHYFPRASTDAMITWMVTRPLFAIAHPGSDLWRIRQPLGGEILLTRWLAEKLASDPLVSSRSDWGIDTVVTYAALSHGAGIFESYVPDGKQHALYGSLADIKTMFHECLQAALDVGSRPPTPSPIDHRADPAGAAPGAVAESVGYDLEASLRLLTDEWTPAEVTAASELPDPIAEPVLANLIRPTFRFCDGGTWFDVLEALRHHYRPEPGWQGLAFRLWVARVIAYTTTDALGGHSHATATLESTLERYARMSADRQQGDRPHP